MEHLEEEEDLVRAGDVVEHPEEAVEADSEVVEEDLEDLDAAEVCFSMLVILLMFSSFL